ncbi:hypothetical protein B9Z49_08005 [Limnohabitans sp. 2KL-51]|nr:hypothetical protein B9Z49_08005 [Limnohabitans sp. 2KL-51]
MQFKLLKLIIWIDSPRNECKTCKNNVIIFMAVIGDGLWVYVFAFAVRVGGLDKSALAIKLENLTINAT